MTLEIEGLVLALPTVVDLDGSHCTVHESNGA
jgi:hypothetical protein